MIKEVDNSIQEYYEQVREKYNIDFEHFSMICKAPFLFFRKMMELPLLPIIKIKYLGKFLIYSNTARRMIKALNKQKEESLISEEFFENRTMHLKKHLYEAKDNENTEGGETID